MLNAENKKKQQPKKGAPIVQDLKPPGLLKPHEWRKTGCPFKITQQIWDLEDLIFMSPG